MELKSYETRAIVLAIAGMLNDVDIRRFEMPVTTDDEELVLYSIASKDGKLDISINPEKKDNYKAEFGENLTKLYNFIFDAKVPSSDTSIDKMQKNWDTMVPLIANSARAKFLNDKNVIDLAKRGQNVMNGFETMAMKASPLTSDYFTLFASVGLVPQFYSARPANIDEVNREFGQTRHELTNMIKRDKQDFIRLMKNKHGASADDATALFNEVYGDENELLM